MVQGIGNSQGGAQLERSYKQVGFGSSFTLLQFHYKKIKAYQKDRN